MLSRKFIDNVYARMEAFDPPEGPMDLTSWCHEMIFVSQT